MAVLNTFTNLEQQEAHLDQFLDQVQFETSTKDLTPEKRRARRKAADADPLAFARTYFPGVFTGEMSELHKWMASRGVGKWSVSGFPMAGKSAFAYLARMVRHIALGKGGIAVAACRTDDLATQRTKSISRVIQRNRLLVYDYSISMEQDSAGYHIFKAEGGTTHLVAGSVNVGLRSIVDDDFKRIRIAVGDDLYNRESVRSDTDNERVYKWIVGELYRQLKPDAVCFVLGNAIAEGAPIVRLKKNYPDQHFSFPIKHPDGSPTWPEEYTPERIAKLEAETDWDVWEGEYMDTPAERGDSFDPDWIKVEHVDPGDILATISIVDPAHGESPTSCSKGAATLAILTDHRIACLDLYIRQGGYHHLFDWLQEQRRRWPHFKTILFEDDFAQWGFAQPYYMQWLERRKDPLPITRFNSRDNHTSQRAADKDSRILTLVHPHSTGLFVYDSRIAVEGNPDWEKYRTQYLGHGKKKTKLDGLDAVASGYIMIRRYLSTDTFKSTGQRRMKKPTWDSSFR